MSPRHGEIEFLLFSDIYSVDGTGNSSIADRRGSVSAKKSSTEDKSTARGSKDLIGSDQRRRRTLHLAPAHETDYCASLLDSTRR